MAGGPNVAHYVSDQAMRSHPIDSASREKEMVKIVCLHTAKAAILNNAQMSLFSHKCPPSILGIF